ncbi:hypothetical protein AcV5_001387 [Taiwanofungus camphoratus]|nr:hypothetical protein AcV5_001387 [Antrodia cinnamomea]KAI0941234.1 hypothetical protein AcV7_002857 [Antrodia cinnamomea]
MIPRRVTHLVRHSAHPRPRFRLLHGIPPAADTTQPGKDPQLSQGTVAQHGHRHPRDPQDQAARAAQAIRANGSAPLDAASAQPGKHAPRDDVSGNPEGVGFAEQVGGQSARGRGGTMGGTEESTPPSFLSALKSKLGFSTSSAQAKIGTGAMSVQGRRELHSSAVRGAQPTRGQAPAASRQPKDRTNAEQNPHLKHKPSGTSAGPDKGKGNAGEELRLPSHKLADTRPAAQQPPHARAFSTSACRRDAKEKHTADAYSKDVDSSPPASSTTHQVDASATGAQVQRANEPPTGGFSQAGSETGEYQTVNRDEPYDVPPSSGPVKEQKLRYGGTGGLKARASGDSGGDAVSKPNEGPEGTSKEGRKPEGR